MPIKEMMNHDGNVQTAFWLTRVTSFFGISQWFMGMEEITLYSERQTAHLSFQRLLYNTAGFVNTEDKSNSATWASVGIVTAYPKDFHRGLLGAKRNHTCAVATPKLTGSHCTLITCSQLFLPAAPQIHHYHLPFVSHNSSFHTGAVPIVIKMFPAKSRSPPTATDFEVGSFPSPGSREWKISAFFSPSILDVGKE